MTNHSVRPAAQVREDRRGDREDDRYAGDVLASSTAEILADSVDDPDDSTIARLQLDMLQAIYRELRHGHDLQAAHTRALTRQTEALGEVAGQLKSLKIQLNR